MSTVKRKSPGAAHRAAVRQYREFVRRAAARLRRELAPARPRLGAWARVSSRLAGLLGRARR